MAIEPFAPPMSFFKRGRDFTALLGLDSRQHSTAGKQILERLEDERARYLAASDHRRYGRRALGFTKGGARGKLIAPHAGAETRPADLGPLRRTSGFAELIVVVASVIQRSMARLK
jgi:hypothetical protein